MSESRVVRKLPSSRQLDGKRIADVRRPTRSPSPNLGSAHVCRTATRPGPNTTRFMKRPADGRATDVRDEAAPGFRARRTSGGVAAEVGRARTLLW
jgi:hypothetical protein